MKKQIVALIVAVAAIVGSLAVGSAAFAEDYGGTGEIKGNTVVFTWDTLPVGTVSETVYVDTEYVSGGTVTPITQKVNGPYYHKYEDGSFSVKATLTKKAISEGTTVTAKAVFLTEDGHTYEGTASQKVPATGASSAASASSGSSLASTGAVIAPYAVVALLLCAAGVVLLVVLVRRREARSAETYR